MENYEQKYKAALNWMRSIYPTMQGADREDAEHHFPDLKESEDERIRKGLIEHLKELKEQSVEGSHLKRPEHYDAWIAWLEKQGEKKPAISDEALHEGIIKFGITQYQIDNWLKKHINVVKQKSAWSEEDEKRFEYCKRLVYASDKYSVEDREETVDWLKSIKDRVQPQPKQEWSEEDEEFISILIERINQLYVVSEKLCKYEDRDRLNPKHKDWLIEKIKSLKPNHWKPSKKQMDELEYVTRGNSYTQLTSLYQDLKKL